MPNYRKYCTGWLKTDEIPRDMVGIVREYTGGPDWFCSKVNFALATDYEPRMQQHSRYIRSLKYCIGRMGCWNGHLYRGLNLVKDDIDEMVRLKRFYIASFTSASTSRDKAFPGNTRLVIDATNARWALPMNDQLSIYHKNEQEVLLTCYTLFDLVSVSGNVVSLKVVDIGGGWYNSRSFQTVLS